ncbi:hypothetical protein LR48_Vigan412s000800 [Vigna angularis]|uniref:Uncharacterized protein n=1 Tax=Phaseolus angularis TaxID=3914 RepID=A0A0L9TAR7_PHAAN|nr:hypothetical protein LR48_Vigan412s000800 [Vigna angularis]
MSYPNTHDCNQIQFAINFFIDRVTGYALSDPNTLAPFLFSTFTHTHLLHQGLCSSSPPPIQLMSSCTSITYNIKTLLNLHNPMLVSLLQLTQPHNALVGFEVEIEGGVEVESNGGEEVDDGVEVDRDGGLEVETNGGEEVAGGVEVDKNGGLEVETNGRN